MKALKISIISVEAFLTQIFSDKLRIFLSSDIHFL